MAIRNRKLFPSLNSSNETYCPDLCDPSCPYYDCPDLYFSPPPPQPPPPPPLIHSSTAKAGPFSPSLITALALLSGFFILLGYYVIIVKSCFCRRSRNNPQPPPSDLGNEEFLDENRVDHPIWFITTVGLQQSIINAITACKYRKGEGLIEGSECSVCLNDFREGETLRLLPKCSHAFHIRCIDTWLRSHTNCPLCRANIVAPGWAEQGTRAQPERELLEQNGRYPDAIREAQVEDLRESNGLDGDQQRNGSFGNRGRTEETEELQGEDGGDVVLKHYSTRDDEPQMEKEIETKNTSASLPTDDSSSSSSSSEGEIYVEVEIPSASTAALEQGGGASADSSLTGQCAVPVERSRSCGSGFFLSRHSRTSSSNLPF